MALNPRQMRAYKDLVDLWAPSRTVDTSGEPSGDTFTLVASNVVCKYEYTDNISDPTSDVGRVKRPTIFTDDKLHMEAAQQCGEGWMIVNRTLLSDGSQSSLYNQVHRCLGVARVNETRGVRRANKRSLMITVHEKPPTAIKTYYGI